MRYKKKKFAEYRKWCRYNFFGKAELTVSGGETVVHATVANISFAGMGVYSPVPVDKGKRVLVKISFIDRNGKIQKTVTEGKIDWLSKLGDTYAVGIFFDEELNIAKQPLLIKHLAWLINTYKLPQPFKDKRVLVL